MRDFLIGNMEFISEVVSIICMVGWTATFCCVYRSIRELGDKVENLVSENQKK